jgi:membrane protease YdiL (CAAX protease family)
MQPAPSYDAVTIPYLLMVLGWMPVMGVLSYLRLKSGKPLPPKSRRYRGMIALQIVLLGYSLVIAQQHRVDLLGRVPGIWTWSAAAVYLTWIAFRLHRAWKKLNAQRKQRARILLPENPGELRYWVPISLLAGLSEECAFRGMAYVALQEISGSVALAMTVCVLAFAVAHMMQGWRGMLGTGVIALILHGIVYLTQGLWLAIAVHTLYDLIVGTIAMRHFMRDDLLLASEAQPISAGA